MKKSFLHSAALGLISSALLFANPTNAAEDKKPEKPAAEKAGAAKPEKKPRAMPFRGKVTAADKTDGTLTVGKRVFHVTSETKVTKQGKTATLDEAVVGEDVTGSYLKTEDGKMKAASIRLSPNPEGGEAGNSKKKKQSQSEAPKEKIPKTK